MEAMEPHLEINGFHFLTSRNKDAEMTPFTCNKIFRNI